MDAEKLKDEINTLELQVADAYSKLEIDSRAAELKSIDTQMLESDFWNDNLNAQKVSKRKAQIEESTEAWVSLKESVDFIAEMISAPAQDSLNEVESMFAETEATFNKLKKQLKFTGEYDSYEVILGIYAGAGGTDAQDWAEMLLRMYTRWTEKSKLKVELIDESRGDEAGLKSVSLKVMGGAHIFGRLKSEHGVHRLVRLSPFNSDNLRQTSFAKVEVMPLIDTPEDVEIDDKDLKIDTYRSSGNGGQSVNTTDSAVRITHLPTNIVVAIQNEKSQLQNKETAMKILRSRLAQLQLEQHAEKVSDLKGPNQSAEWGNQIRNYVLHPYKLVKDTRTGQESSDPDKVLDGALDEFIDAYLVHFLGE